MGENPNWNNPNGSDLPRPKQKPKQINGAQTPNNRIPPKQTISTQRPPADSKQTLQPQQPTHSETNAHNSYGSDTMSFPAQRRSEEYDTEFEQRRAAPPRNVKKSPQRQMQPPPRKMQQHPPQRHAPVPPPPPPRKKRRRSSWIGRLIRGAITLVAAVFLVYSLAALLLIGRLEKYPQAERSVTSGSLDASHVTSILLIGTDARDENAERGRSDSMILVSINSKTKTIYLTSFMRDAYVEIPNYGYHKLNSAYSFGGAELLMDTLELNYQVSIDDYMSISFAGFAGVIDAFGGVEITISDSEAEAINTILKSEVNKLLGDDADADLLSGGGTYVLNGKQALSYSRIRYVGNADFERTSRQREVMSQLLGNLKTKAATALPKLASSALPHVGTNMSTGEMYLLSLRAPLAAGYGIEQLQIPADGTWSNKTVDGQSVLTVDFEENTAILQDTVYASDRK